MKQLQKSNKDIARKLGWTEEQVEERWRLLIESATAHMTNGYQHLINAFNDTLTTYQTMGQKFVPLGLALSNPPTIQDLLSCYVEGKAEETIKNILANFIVLRPFAPIVLPEDCPNPAGN